MAVCSFKKRLFAPAAAFLLIALAATPEHAKPFIGTVIKGYNCSHSDKAYYVIQNRGDWELLWAKVFAAHNPMPSLPEIDFERVTIIAVFQGQQPSSGYEIQVAKVVRYEGSSVARVKEFSPGAGCGVTGGLTQPFHMYAVRKVVGPVSFKIKRPVRDCQ